MTKLTQLASRDCRPCYFWLIILLDDNTRPLHTLFSEVSGLELWARLSQKEQRQEEVRRLRQSFPKKVPVIVDKYGKEAVLPSLDKNRFLLPEDLTVAQFLSLLRNRLSVSSSQAFYLLASKRTVASISETIGSIYATDADEDGFLYMTYASQDAFGSSDGV